VGGIDLDNPSILDDQRYRTVLHLSESSAKLGHQLLKLIITRLTGLHRPALVRHANPKVDVSD